MLEELEEELVCILVEAWDSLLPGELRELGVSGPARDFIFALGCSGFFSVASLCEPSPFRLFAEAMLCVSDAVMAFIKCAVASAIVLSAASKCIFCLFCCLLCCAPVDARLLFVV